MKSLIRFRFIALSGLTLLTCGLVCEAATYQDAKQNIKFDYDEADWEVVPNGGPNRPLEAVDKAMAERTLVTVQRKVADDKYHARFSVVVDPADKLKGSEGEQILAYQKHAVEFLEGQRFHIMEKRMASLGKVPLPAFEIIANQRDFGLLFRQVAVLVGKEAYLVTAAARTAKFPLYKAEIGKMFDSFQFIVPVNKKAPAPKAETKKAK